MTTHETKRKSIHRMQLNEVVEEINTTLPWLNSITEIEMQEDARNFKKYGIWYVVDTFEMVKGYSEITPRCIIKCHTLPDATQTEILVQQQPEEDEEFDSFAHSYLCTLRAIQSEFKRLGK